MGKVRVYFDAAGKILAVENRPDEDYQKANVVKRTRAIDPSKKAAEGIPAPQGEGIVDLEAANWVLVDSEDIGKDSWDDFEVKGKKLSKKKPVKGSKTGG